MHVGGCHKYGAFLGTLHITCRVIIGMQKGTILVTTTHVGGRVQAVSREHLLGGFETTMLGFRVSGMESTTVPACSKIEELCKVVGGCFADL